ncbi:PRC-barrel domain-containing protein [Streptomyces lydicamycinicus]|uniref:PRC-barrel domain-containing protein n=1 Tax=Streptomyces lydicamycinicus TaxID=1546107 RepID=UPI003C30CA04
MNAPLGDAPQSLTGLHVVDADGAKVGKVQQVYRDDATNEPEWITVRTGLFGMKETFIPLAGARRTGDELHVPHAKETIKHAPRIDADGHLDPSEEAELYRHYGMTRPGTVEPGVGEPGGPATQTGPRAAGEAAPPAPMPGERDTPVGGPMAGAGAGTRAADTGDTARGKEQEQREIGTEEGERGRSGPRGREGWPGDGAGGGREGPDRPR